VKRFAMENRCKTDLEDTEFQYQARSGAGIVQLGILDVDGGPEAVVHAQKLAGRTTYPSISSQADCSASPVTSQRLLQPSSLRYYARSCRRRQR